MRAAAPGRRPKPRALRHLAAQHLGLTIQAGEHSPVDDARAALYLYLRFQKVRPPLKTSLTPSAFQHSPACSHKPKAFIALAWLWGTMMTDFLLCLISHYHSRVPLCNIQAR